MPAHEFYQPPEAYRDDWRSRAPLSDEERREIIRRAKEELRLRQILEAQMGSAETLGTQTPMSPPGPDAGGPPALELNYRPQSPPETYNYRPQRPPVDPSMLERIMGPLAHPKIRAIAQAKMGLARFLTNPLGGSAAPRSLPEEAGPQPMATPPAPGMELVDLTQPASPGPSVYEVLRKKFNLGLPAQEATGQVAMDPQALGPLRERITQAGPHMPLGQVPISREPVAEAARETPPAPEPKALAPEPQDAGLADYDKGKEEWERDRRKAALIRALSGGSLKTGPWTAGGVLHRQEYKPVEIPENLLEEKVREGYVKYGPGADPRSPQAKAYRKLFEDHFGIQVPSELGVDDMRRMAPMFGQLATQMAAHEARDARSQAKEKKIDERFREGLDVKRGNLELKIRSDVVDTFNRMPFVAKQKARLASIDEAKLLVERGGAVEVAMLYAILPRTQGEVGNLANTEQVRSMQRKGIIQRVEDLYSQEGLGRIAKSHQTELRNLLLAVDRVARKAIALEARRYSQQKSKAYKGKLSEEEVYDMIMGDEETGLEASEANPVTEAFRLLSQE